MRRPIWWRAWQTSHAILLLSGARNELIETTTPERRSRRRGMKLPRFCRAVIAMLGLLALDACNTRPRYTVGDHLIPLGSSDPTQIVTVASVEKDGYRVSAGIVTGAPNTAQVRTRKEIESYYVRVADLPIGGSWATPTPTPTPIATATPTPQVSATIAPSTPTPQPLDVEKIAATARAAIVRVLLFDASDKPLKPALGCLISADGRVVTSAAAVEHAANAVIELRSGAIKNSSGILVSSPESGLAILKATATGVPFVPTRSAPPQVGEQVAIVGPADPHNNTATAATVGAVRDDAAGTLMQLNGANLIAQPGSPVFDERGEVVGFAIAQESGSSLSSIRSAAALTALVAQIQPNSVAKWLGQSPTPSPSPRQSPSPSPRAGDATLVYTPMPRYPAAARFSSGGPRFGSGQYLVQFGSDGAAQRVSVLKSTGNALLDQAALDALKSWRAQRGRPTQKIVPITFR
jgi:TonB family protein